jgi:hypothetical protein
VRQGPHHPKITCTKRLNHRFLLRRRGYKSTPRRRFNACFRVQCTLQSPNARSDPQTSLRRMFPCPNACSDPPTRPLTPDAASTPQRTLRTPNACSDPPTYALNPERALRPQTPLQPLNACFDAPTPRRPPPQISTCHYLLEPPPCCPTVLEPPFRAPHPPPVFPTYFILFLFPNF